MKKKTKNKKILKKKKTSLPHNISEEEFISAINNVTKKLGHKFKFGYHSFEDMKQQAAIFAMEGLEKYDRSRPLENFLWTHVRNRLFNYKRNNYQRPDKPCLNCPLYDKGYKNSLNQCSKYTDKTECDLYKAWSDRNTSKKNIVQPAYIEDDIYSLKNEDLSSIVQNQEIIKFLDTHVQTEYREIYLKLKHEIKIPKQQLDKLKAHINDLIENQLWKTKNCPKNEDN